MSKLRKVLIAVLVACIAACLSIAVAACNSQEDFKLNNGGDNTQGDGGTGTQTGYVVTVKSAGGLPLNNVAISAKKNGEILQQGLSINGQISFDQLEPGVYELEVDESSLPAGYYIPEGASYVTSADDLTYNISFPSKVIAQTAPNTKRYSVGDVMYDFVFTDSADGTEYKLSDAVEKYNAVMLNFWGITCVPCQAEFPAIQSAYTAYEDKIEIFALSSYGSDTNSQIATYKTTNSYTFPMGLDTPKIYNYFGVTAYPTTVIVDRYGVVAYISTTGSESNVSTWKALFNKYTADDYVQDSPDESGGDDVVYERVLPDPDIKMPSSTLIAAAINGEGTQGRISGYYPETGTDAEYSWPWVLNEDNYGNKYISASNSFVSYSYSIIYCDITLNAGEALSYDYYVDTQAGYDVLYVLINNTLYAEYSGQSDVWLTESNIYIATYDTTIKFALCYIKDTSLDVGTDTAGIRNLTITTLDETDVQYSVVNKQSTVNGKYDVTIELNENDNYYYYVYTDENGNTRKALLLADILNVNPWTEKHIGVTTFMPEAGSTYSCSVSLYQISFWLLSNYAQADFEDEFKLAFDYGYTDTIVNNYYIQQFSDNGLTPVTPELKEAIISFIKSVYSDAANIAEKMGIEDFAIDNYYEDQWLEFCYYYRHYGSEHDGCYEYTDPVLGLLQSNAIPCEEGENVTNITKILNLGNAGGLNYKFTASKTGVYIFYTQTFGDGVDPRLLVYDSNGVRLGESDDDLSYDCFIKDYTNALLYVELVAGQEYIVQTTTSTPGGTGSYKFFIEYVAPYVEFLRVCTTGDGTFTSSLDENGNWDIYNLVYDAINVGLNDEDNIYYHVTDNYEYASKIYIDFVHPNFYDLNNHTLYEFILHGEFDFSNSGGEDYTEKMLEYYNKSLEGKTLDDELYGMVEAEDDLVSIIQTYLYNADGDTPETKYWLAFANYYEYYGTPTV